MRNFNLSISAEIDDRLTAIAARNRISKSEAVVRAFELLSVADDAKRIDSKTSLGIIRPCGDDEWEILAKIDDYVE